MPAVAETMGTPASVGVGLPELRNLFRNGGAEQPEERARLVWRYAGQRRMARVLRRLRRWPAQTGGGIAALRHFGRLRIAEELEGRRKAEGPSGSM
ncbi:arginine vasopressin-induced protein 1 isoform X2 [Pogoniulus pusillus]|uniref:arginine vasopressin-induced protein 1 isoform X2 n=1 Tax=Pogoniulus pusillus TaxID=488313 RepID=UPI0030B9320D